MIGLKRQRKTRQKTAIVKFLNNNTTHPTAEEVYFAVVKEVPRISLGTVYRELKKLSREAKVHEIEGKKRRFDPNTSSHAHFHCEKCDNVFDIDYSIDYEKVKELKNFDVKAHEIMFEGTCKKCER